MTSSKPYRDSMQLAGDRGGELLAGIAAVGLVILAIIAFFVVFLGLGALIVWGIAALLGISISFWQALGISLVINILRSIFAPRTVIGAGADRL